MVKSPNWQEADQLAIYERGWGVELWATEKQLQLTVRAGFEPGTSGFQVWRPNHSTTLPPLTYNHFSYLFVLNIFSRINKINSEASRSSVMRICTKRLDCSTGKEKSWQYSFAV